MAFSGVYPNSVIASPDAYIVAGLGVRAQDIGNLFYELSGVEKTIGLNPAGSYPSMTARLTGIETGYFNKTQSISLGAGLFINTDITSANPAHSEGRLFYDNTDKALSYYNDDANVTVNMGQEVLLRARNATGAALIDGAPVHIDGSQGDKPTVHASIASTFTGQRLVGLVTSEIADSTDGYVCMKGVVHNVSASALGVSGVSAGTTLYISPTTSGQLTTTRPVAPNFVALAGYVSRVYGNGNIDIVVTNEPPAQLGWDGPNSVLGINSAGNGPEYKVLSGVGSVSVSHSSGVILLSGTGGDTSNFLLKTGDTMTGNLNMQGSIVRDDGSNLTIDATLGAVFMTADDDIYLTSDWNNNASPSLTLSSAAAGNKFTVQAGPNGRANLDMRDDFCKLYINGIDSSNYISLYAQDLLASPAVVSKLDITSSGTMEVYAPSGLLLKPTTHIVGSASGVNNIGSNTKPMSAVYSNNFVSPVGGNASASGTVNLDLSSSPSYNITLSGNTTFTFSNPVTGGNYLIKTVNPASYTITWPTAKWSLGISGTATVSGTDIFTFWYDGSEYYGNQGQNFF